MRRKLDREPQAMRTRRQTVEPVFGTIEAWWEPATSRPSG
jgi:hypothetical protein